jgi:DNA repair protein RecO (recombination protein O)
MNNNNLQPAFILFSRPFQDNSVIIDVFSPAVGRFGIVVKHGRASTGTHKSNSNRNQQRRALLQPFVPVQLSWQGRGELKSLLQIEADGTPMMLQGERLFSGLYLNELLTRLLHRYDAYPSLYAGYVEALHRLAGNQSLEWILRRFELQLLNELGYGVDLVCDGVDGSPLSPATDYRLTRDDGFLPVYHESQTAQNKNTFRGVDLLALAAGEESEHLRPVAKRLCRLLLAPHLGDKPLQSRELMKALAMPVLSEPVLSTPVKV